MAEDGFNLLVESLLISLSYNEKAATIELVSDYPLERQQYGFKAISVRGFMKLTVQQVGSVKFRPGFQLIPLLKPSGYSTCNSPQTIVFQQARSSDSEICFDFGHSYGELTFRYVQVSKQTKIAYAIRSKDSEFQYFDIITEKAVDFCYPFGLADQ